MAVMTLFQSFSKTSSALVLTLIAVAGCATATIDNAVPTSAKAEMPAPASADAQQAGTTLAAVEEKPVSPSSGDPINSGAYPNINIVPEGETSQLSDADSANLRNTLYAEQAAQRMPGEPAAAYVARLRKLQSLG